MPDPIFQDLVPLTIPLTAIYLDPNNPRFTGPKSQTVADTDIDSEPVQENARILLVRDYGVEKLRMNMEVNGYLPMDRVVVRRFKTNKYVVLEGNRRICAAKMIGPFGVDGTQVAQEVLASVLEIPCLEYVGSESNAAWIFQGLRHITGISEWSAYNKARLLVEQMEQEQLSLSEAGRRFGLSPFGAGQWVRGYYAFKQAREDSDYVREVDERAYPYFQELFSRTTAPLRDWLEWRENEGRFENALNFNEFVSWLYPRPTDEEGSDGRGDFDNRRLTSRDELRQIAFLIKSSDKFFQQFRNGQPLNVAFGMANTEAYQKKAEESTDRARSVFDAMATCTKALDDVPFKVFKDVDLKREFEERLTALETAIAALK